jgi:glutathione S-transferase
MKLHGLPGTCSLVDHIALQWTGAPFEYVSVPRNALKVAPFIDISPLGAVPVLEDDGLALTQNVAILEYLSEKFPQAHLLGGNSIHARAETRRWLAFLNADLHKAFSLVFAAARWVEGTDAQASLASHAVTKVKEMFSIVNHHLAGREWLSDARSVADAYLYVVMRWAAAKKIDLTDMHELHAHFKRMQADPAVQAALQAEGLK